MAPGLPAVSCMCLTYGRHELLEEAIYSFLLQEYDGRLELVVINDHADQTLTFDHPDVRIFNLGVRTSSIGEKRNLCARLSTNSILLPWDDDDVCLPNRVATSVRYLGAKPYWNPRTAIMLEGSGETATLRERVSGNYFHGASAFTRAVFEEVGGYPDTNRGEDAGLEALIDEARVVETYPLDASEVYYLYRWGNGAYHLSAVAAGEGNALENVDRFLENAEIPKGKIALCPQWHVDYVTLARDLLASEDEPKPA